MDEKLEKNTYAYRMIKQKFPEYEEFTTYYYCGDYYNLAYTAYYANGKEIYRETHNYYG